MELLSFEGFEVRLEKELEKRYPGKWKVVDEVIKINQTKKGILIECSEETHASIYPDDLYEAYESSGDMDVVLEIVDAAMNNKTVSGYVRIIRDWELSKNCIKPYVMNLKKNRMCVKKSNYIYQERLDLAYGCYINLPEDEEGGSAGVQVSQGLLGYWGVSEEEVFAIAHKNATYDIKPMRVVMQELLGNEDIDTKTKEDDVMFVLSNAEKYRGAAGMFDTELIQAKADELDCNFYILPSSLHEVILLKEEAAPSAEGLKEMVEEINQTQVRIEDYLSDSIYYYDRKTKEVTIIE